MGVVFAGQSIIPAPLVTLQKVYVRGEDGFIRRTEIHFSLKGTIVNIQTGDSLNSPGVIDVGMHGILEAQTTLRNIFANNDGGRLEITSPDGGLSIDAFCKVGDIVFEPSVWVNICNYTITLVSNTLAAETLDPDLQLESSNESWNVIENDDYTFTFVHSLSAKGSLAYYVSGANDPLSVARGWVQERLYFSQTDGTLNNNTYFEQLIFSNLLTDSSTNSVNFWNRATFENVDPFSHTWAVTETFIYNPSGYAREIFTAAANYEPDNLRKVTITLNGDIVGYADNLTDFTERNANALRWYQTQALPNLYIRAGNYIPVGYILNPQMVTKQVTYDRGSIKYSSNFVAYNGGTMIPNAIEENVNIVDVGQTDVFAQIPIPGRENGPIVQYMGTSTLPERTVNITATIAPSFNPFSISGLRGAYLSKPNTNSILQQLTPGYGYYYIKQDTEDWNPIRNQYSRNVSWTIDPEGQDNIGTPTAPNYVP